MSLRARRPEGPQQISPGQGNVSYTGVAAALGLRLLSAFQGYESVDSKPRAASRSQNSRCLALG
jgi:hypothetical protein